VFEWPKIVRASDGSDTGTGAVLWNDHAVCVFPFQISNPLSDFHDMWYGHYAVRLHL